MTEKRFIIDEYFEIGSVIIDTENENVRFKHENKLSMKQCCDLLNKLHDENELLKKSIKRQQSSNDECAKLIEEQQKEINTFIVGNKTLQARLKEVSAENKNTKAILEDFMDILNKIQANPTVEKLLNIARDMLQNMNQELEE